MHRAHLSLDTDRVIGRIRPRLFGSFVEHLGRAVYDGLYEPGHPAADEHGFRRDVVELVRELGVTAVRYPGGNFVSGYRWEDGVGPREDRPRRLDLAWHSTETNEIGLHEFQQWLDLVGAELMLALNLGTRGVAEALDLLEYANLPAGTTLARRRADNGRLDPFDVRIWCLGNELDGPWQLGHRSADDYGKLAAMTARAMRAFDPDLELVVCGSSGRSMPTFGAWERTVLEHAYDVVDLISCHAYYEDRGDRDSFLASSVDMDRFITEVVAIADEARAARGSDRRIDISFDEWNVWYMTRSEQNKITGVDDWPVAPRLLEDVYTVTDAVVVGSLLITLLRHADRVASASLAQLVNVIAPIMTEPGGPAWRQTTFHPFAATARHAGAICLDVAVASDRHHTQEHGEVDLVDAVATLDDEGTITVFAVNRASDAPTTLDVDLPAGDYDVAVRSLHDDDLDAVNTAADPERVVLRPLEDVRRDGSRLVVTLPAVSWSEIRLVPRPSA